MIIRANTRFGVVISGKIAVPYFITPAPPNEPTTSFATYTKSSFCFTYKIYACVLGTKQFNYEFIIAKEQKWG